MKHLVSKLIMLTVTLLSATAGSATELRMTPFVVEAAGVAEISVALTTDEDYNGFQTQIVLPEGLSFSNGEEDYVKLADDISLTHQVTYNLVGDTLKLVCFSPENDFFPHNGNLFSFSVRDTNGFTQGEIRLINTLLSDASNRDVAIPASGAEGTSILITRSPEVTIIKHGVQTTLKVIAEGGFSEGFAYEWTRDGERIGTESSLSVTGEAEGGEPESKQYCVRVTDSHEGIVVFDRSYSFSVESWPLPDLETEASVSREKIRENDSVTLNAVAPSGGYTDWRWGWSMDGSDVSDDLEFTEVISMAPGTSRQTDVHSFTFRAINYGPDGEIWGEPTPTEKNVTVYRRPLTPQNLSYTLEGGIYRLTIEAGVSEEEILANGYNFTLGYESPEGEFVTVYSGQRTTCDLEGTYYGDVIDNLWCYATWTYGDDSVVSSGRRHISGALEEDFDASVFSDPSGVAAFSEEPAALEICLEGRTVRVISRKAARLQVSIYSISGELLVTQASTQESKGEIRLSLEGLTPGIYLLRASTPNKIIARKFLLN